MAETRDINAEHARAAAQIQADVGVEHIARVYAQALLAATEKLGQTAAAVSEFDALLTEVLDRSPKFEQILASALVSPEEKAGIIDRVFRGRTSATVTNFLKVVARHGRLDCLRAIHQQTHALWDKLRNRIPVQLTTAVPLDPAKVENITQKLRTKLHGEPVVEQRTDPALIGGVVLRVGDAVYDGSVANQLEKLRQQIVQTTGHEIQSRRDRFRYSAGN